MGVSAVGRTISRFFDDVEWFGTVDKWMGRAKLYHVKYDDEDSEEIDEEQLLEGLVVDQGDY
jgi:hypothetical protein